MRRPGIYYLVLILLLVPSMVRAQSCRYHLPFCDNFDNDYALDIGWVHPGFDTTLVFRENCWTQYLYRTEERWSFIANRPRYQYHNYALRLYASRTSEDTSRVQYTYMVSPAFHEVPTIVSFDYCNLIVSPEKNADSMWIDITSGHVGVLQLGYTTDTTHPESSYHSIVDITMDPAVDATDSMHHFRLDLRTLYNTLPPVKQIAFKMLTDMTGVQYTNIYIDNFCASTAMDTVTFRDTICPGQAYSGYGFTVDSTETTTVGLHTFARETMESYGMVHYRLRLWVEEPVTTTVDTALAIGDTLLFLDSLIIDTGTYVFTLTSVRGCDSTVVLHVENEEVSLVSSAQKVCSGDEVTLTVSGMHTYRWASTPPDPTLASQQGHNPAVVHPTGNTVYQVLDMNGVSLASVSVEVELCEGIWFPNIFTPDAESNNRFVIQTSLSVEAFELTIYNRTGLLVWHCEDINQTWDGTRNGIPLPQGTYAYRWRLKSNNRIRTGIGTVTLLR